MKKTVISLLATAIVLAAGAVFSGCQEEAADASSMRRARLVADENIALKKQIEERDKEVEKQKQRVEECKQEMTKGQEQTGSTMLQMMQHLAESGKQAEALAEENKQLKARIAELEARLAASKPAD
ncbi:MAG: hypothetical protein IH624_06505 [Phycisphaerae bacterium]|nr:hypothetical protein [Phycisphaerae bacterium]